MTNSDRLAAAGAVLTDLSADLSGYADGIDADPQRLDALMSRRVALKEIVRSYGAADGTAGVLRWADEARRRIDSLDDSDERLAALREECAAAEQAVGRSVDASELLPGDLVVWDGHVAMVIGDGQMVEAGDPVQVNLIRTTNMNMGFKGFWRPTG